MKASITFAEIRALQKYLSSYEGGFIEKNYSGDQGYSFKIRKSGLDSIYLHFVNDSFLFVSQENKIEGKKNSIPLENVPIHRVRQIGTDRILSFEGPKNLVIEMMGGGNLIVVQEGKTIFSERPIKRKNGIIRIKEDFYYPEIIDLESNEFDVTGTIKESRSDPIRTLATKLGLSKYGEEVVCAFGNNVTGNEELIKKEDKLREIVSGILKSAEDGLLYIYEQDFFVIRSYCKSEDPEIIGIEEGLERVYTDSLAGSSRKGEAIKRSVEKMKGEMEKLRVSGEYIMQHLEGIEELISKAKRGEVGDNKMDYEKQTITLDADGTQILLKLNESAGENANDYFGASKRIKDRLSRVKFEPEQEKPKVTLKKVKRVFTNYRWFVTSDGNLLISGKDAGSNDSVVKKYLDEKDIYFHADIHGAPSVVMKIRNEPTEKGIGEAASFAWCMSKAWGSEFGNGSVYYVTKSQVSKTPESGEYLAKGAWIIRGKKNYVSHLNLELAVGFQKYENREYVVSAPQSAIEGKKVIISPGQGKEDAVEEIAEFLGTEKEAIYPVLPPGGIGIKEKINS